MDITTIADLLNEFVSAETEILNKQDIKHPTTIGTMFEGLTETVLKKSVFKGLNLRVIKNSFISGCDTEFDVMLVEGDGEQIPYTDRYKYMPEQIIAVIQVKKNLYSKDIKEGFSNLQFLIDNFEPKTSEKFIGRLFRDGFRATCRKDITADKAGELTENEDCIFHTLRIEAFLPVRIIWGYNGFASEFSFRESFFEYLKANLTTDLNNKIPGFGPHNFPNLIFCGQYSMIKQNGMPFSCPIQIENWWPFYTSSSYNPTKFFLEAIWTRLSYKFEQLPMDIFGEDLTMEPVNRFLDCRIKEYEGNYGWEYNYFTMSKKSLKEHIDAAEWQPVELDMIQNVIVSVLCKKEEIDLTTDTKLESFVMEEGLYKSLSDFVEKLKSTGLVFVENNKLKLLTDQCQCAILPNGKFVAGENKSGRFTNWFMREIAKSKNKKTEPSNETL
ncbi:DUF6602 domain-containing protein [Flavobacterium plurextorum]|uniref:DUF6602 domain-containing protein n=1 Tax=Flavobacterium oncorhynchi TaxID=728056 RepID=A0A226HYC9_9FLAO|nr:DUF6602 domain-containing protein [Flavobacterium oncorhynchi]OXA99152.1 hypothetical protein B0A75_12075 [Flavobacterium oncorhynchi]